MGKEKVHMSLNARHNASVNFLLDATPSCDPTRPQNADRGTSYQATNSSLLCDLGLHSDADNWAGVQAHREWNGEDSRIPQSHSSDDIPHMPQVLFSSDPITSCDSIATIRSSESEPLLFSMIWMYVVALSLLITSSHPSASFRQVHWSTSVSSAGRPPEKISCSTPLRAVILILLLIAGIEPNPGPKDTGRSAPQRRNAGNSGPPRSGGGNNQGRGNNTSNNSNNNNSRQRQNNQDTVESATRFGVPGTIQQGQFSLGKQDFLTRRPQVNLRNTAARQRLQWTAQHVDMMVAYATSTVNSNLQHPPEQFQLHASMEFPGFYEAEEPLITKLTAALGETLKTISSLANACMSKKIQLVATFMAGEVVAQEQALSSHLCPDPQCLAVLIGDKALSDHIASAHNNRYVRDAIHPIHGLCTIAAIGNGLRFSHIPHLLEHIERLEQPPNGAQYAPAARTVTNLARRNLVIGPNALFNAATDIDLVNPNTHQIINPNGITISEALQRTFFSLRQQGRRTSFCQCSRNHQTHNDSLFNNTLPVYYMRTNDTSEFAAINNRSDIPNCNTEQCQSAYDCTTVDGFLFAAVVNPLANLNRKPHQRTVIGPKVFRLAFALTYRAVSSPNGRGNLPGNNNQGPFVDHVDTYVYTHNAGFYIRNGMRYPESDRPDPDRVRFAALIYYITDEQATADLQSECAKNSSNHSGWHDSCFNAPHPVVAAGVLPLQPAASFAAANTERSATNRTAEVLHHLHNKVDFVALSEIGDPKQLDNSHSLGVAVNAAGYHKSVRGRPDQQIGRVAYGGVALLANSRRWEIENIPLDMDQTIRASPIELVLVRATDRFGMSQPLVVGSVYIPPIGAAYGAEVRGPRIVAQALKHIFTKYTPDMLMGDFNARNRLWDPGGWSPNSNEGARGKAIADILLDCKYTATSPGPSHCDHCIDLFIHKADYDMTNLSLMDTNMNAVNRAQERTEGHKHILGTLCTGPVRLVAPNSDTGYVPHTKVHWQVLTAADRTAASNCLRRLFDQPLTGSINTQAATIVEKVATLRETLPKGRTAALRPHRVYTGLQEQAKNLHDRANRIVQIRLLRLDDPLAEPAFDVEAEVEALTTDAAALRQRAADYTMRMLPHVKEAENDTDAAHKLLERAANAPQPTAPIKEGDETWVSDRQKAKGFARLFAQKQARRPNGRPFVPLDRPARPGRIVPAITVEEVKASIRTNGDGKAIDFDGIDGETLKLFPPTAMERLAEFFTTIVRRGRLPDRWKTAVVTALHKPGKDPAQAKSYRPVAITSLLCRTLERIVAARMLQSLRIPHEQFGFRKRTSTVEAISLLATHISDGFAYAQQFADDDKEKIQVKIKATESRPERTSLKSQQTTNQFRTLVASIDLTDAFCRISREAVIGQYRKHGGSSHYTCFLYDFLSDRTQRVRYGNAISAVTTLDLGVPQGSVLGPLAWSIATIDLIHDIKKAVVDEQRNIGYLPRQMKVNGTDKAFTKLSPFSLGWYADDSFIALSGPRADRLVEPMNRVLAKFSEWADQNGLEISTKSNVQLFMKATTSHKHERVANANAAAAAPNAAGEAPPGAARGRNRAVPGQVQAAPARAPAGQARNRPNPVIPESDSEEDEDNNDRELPEIRRASQQIQELRCGNVSLSPPPGSTIFAPQRTLGVIFDSRLSMAEHITKQIEQASKMLRILLTFAPHFSPKVVREMYLAHVFSKLMYASETWYHHAHQAYKDSLDTFHRAAARALAGHYPTVNGDVALAQLDLPAVQEYVLRQRGRTVAKVMARSRHCPLRMRLTQPHDKRALGTGNTKDDLRKDCSVRPLTSDIIANRNKMYKYAAPVEIEHLHFARSVQFDISMTPGVSTQRSKKEQLKQHNQERIARLPSTNCIRIATDGSLDPETGTAAWAAVIHFLDSSGQILEQQTITLSGRGSHHHCICTLEGIALLESLKAVAKLQPFGNIVVLSDSLSMLQTLAKGPCRQTHVLGSAIWKEIIDSVRYSNYEVYLAHVFSHTDLECNDMADEMAGAARVMEDLPVYRATPFDVARVYTARPRRRAAYAAQLAAYATKPEKHVASATPLTQQQRDEIRAKRALDNDPERIINPPFLPRRTKEAVIIHRLLAGVERWIGGHLHGNGLEPCPICTTPVDRHAAIPDNHPTVHCLELCSDPEVIALRQTHFGPNLPHDPSLLWTHPHKVINYYIEWRKLASIRTRERQQ